jgi:hypothetical protein
MVLCDDLLTKQNWNVPSTKSITLHGQEELDCFISNRGKFYNNEIILTGRFGGIDLDEDAGKNVEKKNIIPIMQFNGYNLRSIIIPDTVTSIGLSAFWNCRQLQYVTLPKLLLSINGYAFKECSGLMTVEIPSLVKSIGTGGFMSCTSLKSVIIPSQVESIGSGIFFNCRGLTSVSISDKVKFIDHSSFARCISLTSVTIPSSVTSIVGVAFGGCTKLESVTINSDIKMKNERVFEDCPALTKIILLDTLTDINADIFVGNGLHNIKEIQYNGQNIYTEENFNMETQGMITGRTLNTIKTEIVDEKEKALSLKQTERKKKLKWIIPVSVVSALLLSFIIFKVVRRRPRKQNTKNTKKSKK